MKKNNSTSDTKASLLRSQNATEKLITPKKHFQLPRVPSYVEVNLSEQIKRFKFGKEKNELQINIFPIASPPGCYYIEAIFLVDQNFLVIKFGGMFSDKQTGIDTSCLQLLNWLCSTVPYKNYFSDDICDPDYSIIHDDDYELPRAPKPVFDQ